MEYSATCGHITIRVYVGAGIPHLFVEDNDANVGVCIKADDLTTIKLLRQSLSHIVDTHKHREAQTND